jgi:hypothetical protein
MNQTEAQEASSTTEGIIGRSSGREAAVYLIICRILITLFGVFLLAAKISKHKGMLSTRMNVLSSLFPKNHLDSGTRFVNSELISKDDQGIGLGKLKVSIAATCRFHYRHTPFSVIELSDSEKQQLRDAEHIIGAETPIG